MFYNRNLSLRLIDDYKKIVASLNPLVLKYHTDVLAKKGIDLQVVESTFLDPQNPRYSEYYGLIFEIVANEELYNHVQIQDEEQLEREYKQYNDFLSEMEVSDFVESNLRFPFTVGTYDKETFTKLERASRGKFLDVVELTHFYHQLCCQILVDYEFKSKKKGVVVFEKTLQPGCILSAKYRENELKNDLKLGHLRFPSLSFWISDKSTKEDFLLGMDEHPFERGIMKPTAYLASQLVVKVGDGSYEINSPVEIIQDGDAYTIKPNETLVLNLKKQLTDYMNCVIPFQKSMVNYYEEIAKEIIEKGNMEVFNLSKDKR